MTATIKVGLAAFAASSMSLAIACATPADLTKVTPGQTYFNKTGAALEDHNRDLEACHAIANGGASQAPPTPDDSALYTYRYEPQFLNGSLQVHTLELLNTEHCMVVRGWRVVRLSDEQGKALRKLETSAFVERMAAMVGAEPPDGVIVRTFANEGLRASTRKNAIPSYFSATSLSLKLLDDRRRLRVPGARLGRPMSRHMPYVATSVAPETLSPPGTAEATVIALVDSDADHLMEGFLLERVSRDPAKFAYAEDGGADTFTLNMLGVDFKGTGPSKRTKTLAFRIPAGRWRISRTLTYLEPCMGAPAFEIAPGEVLFLGRFDLMSEYQGPRMDIEAGREAIALAPALATRLAPAPWVNGEVWGCLAYPRYAFEFEGFPYKPDYPWGQFRHPSRP